MSMASKKTGGGKIPMAMRESHQLPVCRPHNRVNPRILLRRKEQHQDWLSNLG